MDDDNPSTSMTSVHFHTHIVSHDECEEGGEGGEEERTAGNVAGGGDSGARGIDSRVRNCRKDRTIGGAMVAHVDKKGRRADSTLAPSLVRPVIAASTR